MGLIGMADAQIMKNGRWKSASVINQYIDCQKGEQPFSRMQGWSEAYGLDDEPSTSQTMALR